MPTDPSAPFHVERQDTRPVTPGAARWTARWTGRLPRTTLGLPAEEFTMPEPHLRAGDTDRAAVATALGRHMADGRLTVAEYDERVARAYAARTYGDLAELTADLPAVDGGRRVEPVRSAHPAPVVRACGPMASRAQDPGSAWAAWRRTAIIVLSIWAISSVVAAQFIYFWPIWVVGPWGAVLLAHTVGGAGRRARSRQHT